MIHHLAKKWRDRAQGDAGLLACADELEAHLFQGDTEEAKFLHAFN